MPAMPVRERSMVAAARVRSASSAERLESTDAAADFSADSRDFGALERGELFVFEFEDGGGGEVDLVIEGVDLRGAGGGVHLLAEARHLGAVCVGVELLTAAEFFFGGEVLADAGERLLGGFESDFGGGDAAGSFGLLLAEALELEVLGLENDEMFEVSIHIGSLSRFPLLFFGGSQRRPGRLPQRLSVALSVYEALL